MIRRPHNRLAKGNTICPSATSLAEKTTFLVLLPANCWVRKIRRRAARCRLLHGLVPKRCFLTFLTLRRCDFGTRNVAKRNRAVNSLTLKTQRGAHRRSFRKSDHAAFEIPVRLNVLLIEAVAGSSPVTCVGFWKLRFANPGQQLGKRDESHFSIFDRCYSAPPECSLAQYLAQGLKTGSLANQKPRTLRS